MMLRKSPVSILVLAGLAAFSTGLVRAQVVVIANSSVTAESISKAELRGVFTGASTKLKDGSHVKPVLLKEGSTHADFVSSDLSMSVASLLVIGRGQVFSGQGTMPRTLDNESDVVAYVARTPGAVGYVSKATPREGVHEIAVK